MPVMIIGALEATGDHTPLVVEKFGFPEREVVLTQRSGSDPLEVGFQYIPRSVMIISAPDVFSTANVITLVPTERVKPVS